MEHLCRTTYIGFVLGNMEQAAGEQVDIGKIIESCLFHDLGEARTTDLDYISQKYSHSDELKAIQDAVKDLPFGPRIINAFLEIENLSTKEGIISKDADQLELLCSLKEIMDNGNNLASDWIPPVLKRMRTESAKSLAEEILKTSSDNWWFHDKNDEYWSKGGKNHN